VITNSERHVRNCIMTVVSNKFTASIRPTEWEGLVASIIAKIPLNTDLSLTTYQYSRIIAFATGAIARLDKSARPILHALISAPSRAGRDGSEMARRIGELVRAREQLSTSQHVIIKPLYIQWVYAHTVLPLLPVALPSNSSYQSNATTIIIISVLRQTDVSMYTGETESLLRILVAALSILDDWMVVDMVVAVLSKMADARSNGLEAHLEAMIKGMTKAFNMARPATTGTTDVKQLAACRFRIVEFFSRLPLALEQRYLRFYAASVNRLLAIACGDRVRQTREAAQAARHRWGRIQ
jgi:hypothetical protein